MTREPEGEREADEYVGGLRLPVRWASLLAPAEVAERIRAELHPPWRCQLHHGSDHAIELRAERPTFGHLFHRRLWLWIEPARDVLATITMTGRSTGSTHRFGMEFATLVQRLAAATDAVPVQSLPPGTGMLGPN